MKSLLQTAAALLRLGKDARPAFVHAERDLAAKLGLAQESLARARASHRLRRGEAWDIEKNLVCYSDAGRAALLRVLGVADSAANAAPTAIDDVATEAPTEKQADEPAAAELQALFDEQKRLAATPEKNSDAKQSGGWTIGEVAAFVVVRLVHNRRVLQARPAGAPRDAETVWVRVKDARNFTVGMELRARWTIEGKWQLEGRCPRQKGKW